MSDLDTAKAFDLNAIGDDFCQDPFPTYRALREHDPVHRNPDGTFLLTRYDDVAMALRHPAMSSDKKVDFKPKFGDSPLYTHHTTSLVFNDPPIHTRVRKLLSAAFTPRKLKELEPLVERVIDDLLDDLAGVGEFDLVEDYALLLPTQVISEMLGIPPEHRHLLRGYSNLILGALDPVVTPENMQLGNQAVADFEAMLEELVAKRRENPEDGEIGEVLAALIFGDVDGEQLSAVELIQNCIFLLNAGHETTANMMSSGIHMLVTNPGQLARLRDDPALIEPAVEEFLRFQSPLQIGNRKATEDVAFGDTMIAAGTFIHCGIAAANRDPAVFEDPENVDIGRTPNRHLAFSVGKHICLGNTLGRIEGRVAVGKFVQKFSSIDLNGPAQLNGRARFRGHDKMPVKVG